MIKEKVDSQRDGNKDNSTITNSQQGAKHNWCLQQNKRITKYGRIKTRQKIEKRQKGEI